MVSSRTNAETPLLRMLATACLRTSEESRLCEMSRIFSQRDKYEIKRDRAVVSGRVVRVGLLVRALAPLPISR